MNGTTFSVTRAIDLMPPTITTNTMAAKITPVIQPSGDSGGVIGVARRFVGLRTGQATVMHSLHTTGSFIPPTGPDSILLAPRE